MIWMTLFIYQKYLRLVSMYERVNKISKKGMSKAKHMMNEVSTYILDISVIFCIY